MLSIPERTRAQSPGDLVVTETNKDYPVLYINSSLTAGKSTGNWSGVHRTGPSPLLIPGSIYHAYGSHYLSFLYKQVLLICSLYWLLAGYRRYRPGRVPDNKRNAAAEF